MSKVSLSGLKPPPICVVCARQGAVDAAISTPERQQAAHLIDFGLPGLGGKQRYGMATKTIGRTVQPLPIEDAGNVNARRAAAGLG